MPILGKRWSFAFPRMPQARAGWILLVSLAFGQVGLGQSTPAPGKPLKWPEDVSIDSLKDEKVALEMAQRLEKEYPAPRSEGASMLIAILRGSKLNGSDGWFGPARSRYSWGWLMQNQGKDSQAKVLARESYKGPEIAFEALDRDGDGKISPSDLDWSPGNSQVIQANTINRIFRRMDREGNGKVSRQEWEKAFEAIAKGKDQITAEQLRQALIPRGAGGFSPGDEPTTPVLVKGLFAGEIGSIGEGPRPGEKAPSFALKTPDGKETIRLESLLGTKPVVLVFGNFTCGPFRAFYPDVDSLYQRYKDHAHFLMVYVREAHPTDGWAMDSNTKMGVKVSQPRTYQDRLEVCAQFRQKLEPGMPLVVDDVDDSVGHAYSGMPARLYVLDPKGVVAYQSGRGPFGFRPGELEQALAYCLLENPSSWLKATTPENRSGQK